MLRPRPLHRSSPLLWLCPRSLVQCVWTWLVAWFLVEAQGADASGHWAFQPLRPMVPPASLQDASCSAIDGFIRERLTKAHLTPSPEADRRTLMRRLAFDLTGLPADPAEVATFEADLRPDAFSRVVDRLLANPRFGERWGRHWLDAARYADSDGYEKDKARPDAWRYRDWVIDAFNQNKPFDRFTLEQIAGDLLPESRFEAHVAAAFHRQTLTNDEGGVDKEQYRVESVFDRVETVGSVWLGLTVTCARCHSHKYDPISQRDYFSLFAFFNNADEVNRWVPVHSSMDTARETGHGLMPQELAAVSLRWELDRARERFSPRLPAWEKEIQSRLQRLRQNSAPTSATFIPANARLVSPHPRPASSGTIPGTPTSTDSSAVLLFELHPPTPELHRLQLQVAPATVPAPAAESETADAVYDVELRRGKDWEHALSLRLHSASAVGESKAHPASAAVDDSIATYWKPSFTTNALATLTLHVASDGLEPGDQRWFLRIRTTSSGAEGFSRRLNLLASAEPSIETIAPESVRRTLTEEPARRPISETEALIEWAAWSDPQVNRLAQRWREQRNQIPAERWMAVRTIGERENARRTTHLLRRGEFLSPGEVVSEGMPPLLPAYARSGANAGALSRLDLAKWMTGEAGFLVARVRVNQIWLKLFGEGLVATPGDFGTRGEPPSHPELLDWLASRFISGGWNQKALIRDIVHSAAYRQNSTFRTEASEIDPRNRLLHRQNRLRIEGETVRDVYLSVSGLLEGRIGGPSAFPAMPDDVAALSYANTFKWTANVGADRYRRGLYTFFKRTAPHPDLMVFDCPDANFALVRRHASNTPLQALTALNAEAFVEAAKALAERVLTAKIESGDPSRIAWLFQKVLCRTPNEAESRRAMTLLDEARAHYAQQPGDATELLQTGPWKSPATRDAREDAAWTVLCRALLNLDETITRE